MPRDQLCLWGDSLDSRLGLSTAWASRDIPKSCPISWICYSWAPVQVWKDQNHDEKKPQDEPELQRVVGNAVNALFHAVLISVEAPFESWAVSFGARNQQVGKGNLTLKIQSKNIERKSWKRLLHGGSLGISDLVSSGITDVIIGMRLLRRMWKMCRTEWKTGLQQSMKRS